MDPREFDRRVLDSIDHIFDGVTAGSLDRPFRAGLQGPVSQRGALSAADLLAQVIPGELSDFLVQCLCPKRLG